MIISHIVAASENNVIGVKGDLPWHIPEDLKFFKETTKGHIIIMGRKTFESLPGKKPLPGRLNIVISRNVEYKIENAIVTHTLQSALIEAHKFADQYGDEVFIVGGGEIYRQSMESTNRIYLTRVHKNIVGDTLYPEIDLNQFELKKEDHRQEPIPFSFQTFVRLE